MNVPNKIPPRWAHWLLTRLHPKETLEEVEGDLDELYVYWYRKAGKTQATWRYVLNVVSVLPPFVRRREHKQHEYQPSNLYPAMLRNYVIVAWRNLVRHKAFSFINITGLALGMACNLLIGLWMHDELSYDRFFPDAEKIYVVHYNLERNGEVLTTLSTPGPLQGVIQKDIPQVAHVTKVANWPNVLVRTTNPTADEKPSKEQGYYATEDFFSVFDVPTLSGHPKEALANPTHIIISRKMAEKYFPHEPALGKQLQLNNDKLYTVGAVIENLPTTSTLQFDWIANFRTFEQEWMKTWGDNPFQTYVRLNPQTTLAQAEAAMKGIYGRYTDWKSAKEGRIYPILQPIVDQHLYSVYQNGKSTGGRIEYVRIFSLVALFILVIACINFMNLSTARSALRTKEVCIRKVVGARRFALVGQFLSESMVMSLLAAVISLGIVWYVLPTFNTLLEKQLALNLMSPGLWLGISGLILITGLLAGSYPALFLSGLPPLRILKGFLSLGTNPATFRQVLVVFQFSLAVFLLVGMLTIGRQMRYLYTKNLGLNRMDVVAIPLEGDILKSGHPEPFRQQLLRLPTVASAVTVNKLPINIDSGSGDLKWSGKDPDKPTEVSGDFVGTDFAKTMAIPVLAGHEFRTHNRIDSGGYILNESAAKLMGMANPIGQEIEFWRGKGPIIGLIQDFHLQSLHQPITPLILAFDDGNASYVLVKIRAGQTERALSDIERLVRQFNPDYPFSYQFLDSAYDSLYRSEQQVNKLVDVFGLLAMLISCLGLFGLVAYMAERRTKEIGIRKVLGASVPGILALLSKDFLKLVLIAIVIASPLAWWAMNRWLQEFAYRIDVEWWEFSLAALLAIGVALLTISFQSINAALVNPVKSLRSE
ncbi:ABC transporter permease [Spirosoma migulaei]